MRGQIPLPTRRQELIKSLYYKAEELAFDAVMRVGIPLLILWANHGLQREELSEELREFWNDYKALDED